MQFARRVGVAVQLVVVVVLAAQALKLPGSLVFGGEVHAHALDDHHRRLLAIDDRRGGVVLGNGREEAFAEGRHG
eukprot:6385686-Prymnesium_polylepis.1